MAAVVKGWSTLHRWLRMAADKQRSCEKWWDVDFDGRAKYTPKAPSTYIYIYIHTYTFNKKININK